MSFRNRLSKRRSIILTWIISYFSILFLPILVSLAVNQESGQTLRGEINRANATLLAQLRDNMDHELQNVRRLNMELSLHTMVQSLMYSNKYANNSYVYDVYETSEELRLFKASYPFVDNFYIYWAAQNTVILPGTNRDSKFAFEDLHGGSPSMSYEEWLSIMQRKNYHGFLPMQIKSQGGSLKPAVAFITSFPAGPNEQSVGSCVILIDAAKFLDMTDKIRLFSGGQVYVLNDNNTILVSNSPDTDIQLPQIERLHISKEVEFAYKAQDGQQYEVMHAESSISGLSYVSLIPSTLFWEKDRYVRNLTIVSIVISLTGGSILTYFLLLKNYGPLHRLLRSVAAQTGVSYSRNDNEFQYIEHVFMETIDEKDKIGLHLKQQNQLFRSNFLNRLLKGLLDAPLPVEHIVQAYGIDFQSSRFAVLVFYLNDIDKFLSRLDQKTANEKMKLLRFIITNVVEELAGKTHLGYVCEADDLMVCLINFSGQTEHDSGDANDLRQIATEAREFLLKKFHIDATISISSSHPTLNDIPIAYKEALDVMEYKLVMGSSPILSHEDIRSSLRTERQGTDYFYPIQLEQQLMNCLKAGDYDQAKITMDSIIEHNFSEVTGHVHLRKYLLFNLMSTLIKTVDDIGALGTFSFTRDAAALDRLHSSKTIEELQSLLTEALQEICSHTSAKRKLASMETRYKTHMLLIQDVIDYVNVNYRDRNLNNSLIGQLFDLKPSYIARLFKEQTGQSLIDFISKTRVERSKELLLQKELTVGEISEVSGFNDVHVFIRTFKKIEGITPGAFKEMNLV
ncbi:helix-turn-helix domain-containing protein [Paenibacillus sp. FSL H7-0331]|uniref:helix-turn-helix domain-containing protein n=1 Tax=Paenibacillus sp. FSL H7-0331 TaxID=1920421 RepID=UPI00096CC7B7|nr:hypothetical protein BK127_33590 [Paenibacillus sp. FSL H7-0331]